MKVKLGKREVKKGTGTLSKVRSKPGLSNAGKYPNVHKFAGPDGSFPINTIARARNALARAGMVEERNPSLAASVRRKVYKAYPELNKNKRK